MVPSTIPKATFKEKIHEINVTAAKPIKYGFQLKSLLIQAKL